jgi:hypothetical protein
MAVTAPLSFGTVFTSVAIIGGSLMPVKPTHYGQLKCETYKFARSCKDNYTGLLNLLQQATIDNGMTDAPG